MGDFQYTDNYDGVLYTLRSDNITNLREEPLNVGQNEATGTNSRLRGILLMWGQALNDLYGYATNPFTENGVNGITSMSLADKTALATLNNTFGVKNGYDRLVYSEAGLAPEPDVTHEFSCPDDTGAAIPNIWKLISENVTYSNDESMDFSFCVNNTETNQSRDFGEFIGNLYTAQVTNKSNPDPLNSIPDGEARMIISTELHNILAPFPYAVPSGTADDFPYEGENFTTVAPPTFDNLPDLSLSNPLYTTEKGTLQYSLGRLWENMATDGLLLFSVPCANNNQEELFITGSGTECALKYYTRDNVTGDITNYFLDNGNPNQETYTDPDETPALFCPPIIRRVNRSDLELMLKLFSGDVNASEGQGWLRLNLADATVKESGIVYSGDKSGTQLSNVNTVAAETQFSLVYAVKKGLGEPHTLGETIFRGSEYSVNVSSIDVSLVQTTLSSVGGISDLKGVQLGSSVQTIQPYAFNPDQPGNVTISLRTLQHKSRADSQLKEIGNFAFSNCTLLENTVYIPVGVSDIGAYAFNNCIKLNEVILGDAQSLLTIGSLAFSNCNQMKGALTFPENLISIGNEAFNSCANVGTINLSGASQLTGIGDSAFLSCLAATGELQIPQSVLTIADYAFDMCGSLQTINLASASQLQEIGAGAFQNCVEATGELQIPQSVLTIGGNAFLTCEKLNSINLAGANELTSIGTDAFLGCEQVGGTIAIPGKLTGLSESAFRNFTAINSIDLSGANELTSIGTNAFSGCEQVGGTIAIPGKLTGLSDSAFVNFTAINSIDLSGANELTSIGEYAFYFCTEAIGELQIPQSVLNIENFAFYNCTSLQTLNLAGASQLTSIGTNAFYNCRLATGELQIPQSVLNIGNSTFKHCEKLQTLNLAGASQLTRIGDNAFERIFDANGELQIPQSVLTIGAHAFGTCPNLQTINLAGASQLTGIGTSAFLGCNQVAGTIAIPGKVTELLNDAFNNFTALNSIDLRNAASLTKLGNQAFNNCNNATGELYIPGSLLTVGNNCFNNCGQIQSINLCDMTSLKSIEVSAFANMGQATGELCIPEQVTGINIFAFTNCTNIGTVNFKQNTSANSVLLFTDGMFSPFGGMTLENNNTQLTNVTSVNRAFSDVLFV